MVWIRPPEKVVLAGEPPDVFGKLIVTLPAAGRTAGFHSEVNALFACQFAASGQFALMNTLQEIKAAIPKLTLEERAEVARCLHGWEDDEWDEQMKQDLAAGKLNPTLAKVDADISRGNYSDLP